MIKFEHTEVVGWEHAIRGMRNPKNSWNRMDSKFWNYDSNDIIGENDMKLMKILKKAGTDHRKYLRQIAVYVDITAPLYWWKEFDTYKVGTVANSCSTMHKIADKELTLDDFSHEHLFSNPTGGEEDGISVSDWEEYKYYAPKDILEDWIIPSLNNCREKFVETKDKRYWWQMIQLLPSSYNQKRTVMLNYEVLNNIYKSRKGHPLDEWRVGFIEWINSLPYAKELIIGEE